MIQEKAFVYRYVSYVSPVSPIKYKFAEIPVYPEWLEAAVLYPLALPICFRFLGVVLGLWPKCLKNWRATPGEDDSYVYAIPL